MIPRVTVLSRPKGCHRNRPVAHGADRNRPGRRRPWTDPSKRTTARSVRLSLPTHGQAPSAIRPTVELILHHMGIGGEEALGIKVTPLPWPHGPGTAVPPAWNPKEVAKHGVPHQGRRHAAALDWTVRAVSSVTTAGALRFAAAATSRDGSPGAPRPPVGNNQWSDDTPATAIPPPERRRQESGTESSQLQAIGCLDATQKIQKQPRSVKL